MAVVEYDGTAYYGFQIQAQGPTIQAVLEKALGAVTQEQIRVTGAGRTDTGVHAMGQVIHFDTAWTRPVEVLQRALNAVLPRDIAVRELQHAPDDFHARFDARSRVYRYTIINRPVRAPLVERFAYHVPEPLDTGRMATAAQALIGTHDFAAFGQPMRAGGSAVRTVYAVDCRRDGEIVTVEIEADAFLRRMVRRIVSGLVEIGLGRMTPEEFVAIKESGDPARLRGLAPAHGLCLIRVNY